MSLHIVLVEPEIPQNTGNIARTCAALGATLHLVEPLGFSIDEKAVRRAGLDYWNKLDLYTYPSLDAFLAEHGGGLLGDTSSAAPAPDSSAASATNPGATNTSPASDFSATPDSSPAPNSLPLTATKPAGKELLFLTTKGSIRYSDYHFDKGLDTFLLFGKESAGLPEELLAGHKDRALRVPMRPNNRSLNLANTVAIVAYEVFRQWDFPDLESAGELHRLQWGST